MCSEKSPLVVRQLFNIIGGCKFEKKVKINLENLNHLFKKRVF